ncbi:hypothetical protein STRPS_0916 [Streptococcus pseudoporcinus LQ 940-04]|uniref:Uncharacterized protein n=1 Tax=Streptococcus pseudoporcinus LQ 940-04 TaxID=875093 RepID=G5KAF8_9STRE|nr:hypothetical protein HMPREF9320_0042 [Streptococcus pseudoporcinus SPIN 20026]EHI65432.1 hypothetical protein STRPS_0916 [Streptococcus pseudoporcinus LQ 940-04]
MFVKYFMTNLLTLSIRKEKENSAIVGRAFFLETRGYCTSLFWLIAQV